MKRSLELVSLALFICLAPGGLAQGQVAINVSPSLPSDIDIPGGAPAATLQQAAAFAWQEFIALNWPAMKGQRDVADPNQKFGAGAGPLVWETFRGKVEIFNLIKDDAGNYVPPGYSATASDYGYNTGPEYFYRTKSVPACLLQTEPAPAWVNLDETTEIGLAQMFAGGPAIEHSANTSPQLIRFAVKANHVEYEYVAKNQYFISGSGSAKATAATNNVNAYAATPPIAPPPPPVGIGFMPGTVEIKSAWRPLNAYDNPARFHVQTVRFYENKGPDNTPCYFEQRWGLIALHIIQKTPSAPAFIYATFEQADNIRRPSDSAPVEDPDGNVINPPSATTPTTPALAYEDSSAPKVTVTPTGALFCTPQTILYFKDNSGYTGLTGGGAICVNQRYEPIQPDVIAVNLAAHVAITSYSVANGIESPWLYYKLVSVQASPFDVSRISPTDPIHGRGVFFQANIVVETNYTLQQFQGRIAGSGAPTAVPSPPPKPLPPPNVFTPASTTTTTPPGVVGVNMGGCMGCHGNAQVTQGTDFSFILAGGATPYPDTPSALGDAALRTRYLDLFRR
jgi:hypothetical protein